MSSVVCVAVQRLDIAFNHGLHFVGPLTSDLTGCKSRSATISSVGLAESHQQLDTIGAWSFSVVCAFELPNAAAEARYSYLSHAHSCATLSTRPRAHALS